MKWLRWGDKNSKFFHAIASTRYRKKLIVQIRDGRRITRSPRTIKTAVRKFYKKLYTQDIAPKILFHGDLVNKLSVQEAAALESMPSYEEIKRAVWD